MEQNQTPASIGIDVAKDTLDVAQLGTDHGLRTETFVNDRTGINRLIRALKHRHTAPTVPVVLESTGPYHVATSLILTQAGYRVHCINPIMTKKYQRGSIRNVKTDRADAARLAQIGLHEASLPVFTADSRVLEARRLVSYLGKLEQVRRGQGRRDKTIRNSETSPMELV